jgi:hypothetical protein
MPPAFAALVACPARRECPAYFAESSLARSTSFLTIRTTSVPLNRPAFTCPWRLMERNTGPPPQCPPAPSKLASCEPGTSRDSIRRVCRCYGPPLSGYRLRPARIPGRCRFCGDDTRRAVGVDMAVGYRRSGPGGTSKVRMSAGRSGNNGKDAAKVDSSETGLRIDLLRKSDCFAALQPR